MIGISFVYSVKYLRKDHRPNFSLLIDFACATAKDELEKHPEMRTIAMVELENNFPPEFSREVLKCLPQDVNKVILNPHSHYENNNTVVLPKESMVIYVADVVGYLFFIPFFDFFPNFPPLHHLSKRLIISSDRTKIISNEIILKELQNAVQIYAENRKVIARSYDRTKNLTTLKTFEDSQQENLSQILFPDKSKDLNGFPLYAVWADNDESHNCSGCLRPNCKWNFFLDIIAERMNATLIFDEIPWNETSTRSNREDTLDIIIDRNENLTLDFYLSDIDEKSDLVSYWSNEWCYLAELPEPFDLTDQILFLPMDQSCWMWLGITIAVSTLIWRISEGHWNFPFGAFSYFMGQAQLVIRIQTNRLAMKILLQLLIFTFFIFSNGYQSLVTSFMLDPVKVPLLKTMNELLESDLKIDYNGRFNRMYDENPKFQKAFKDGRIMDYQNTKLKLSSQKDIAIDCSCKFKKFLVERNHEEDNWGSGYKAEEMPHWRGAYLIEETANSNPSDLYTRPFHPYIDKFQHFMDRALEAGLHQAWETFYYLKLGEKYPRMPKEETNDILDFGLIAPFFLILAYGLGAALLALWCEIFFKDFVSELSREYFKRKFDEIFGREIKAEKPKVKVIQVRPRQDQESNL